MRVPFSPHPCQLEDLLRIARQKEERLEKKACRLKEKTKVLFTEDMILCADNTKDSTKIFLELVSGYRIECQYFKRQLCPHVPTGITGT
jgi:hypothetical protein